MQKVIIFLTNGIRLSIFKDDKNCYYIDRILFHVQGDYKTCLYTGPRLIHSWPKNKTSNTLHNSRQVCQGTRTLKTPILITRNLTFIETELSTMNIVETSVKQKLNVYRQHHPEF